MSNFKYLALSWLALLNSCTYSINMIHTQGSATDVVDEEQGATADVKPKLVLPLAG